MNKLHTQIRIKASDDFADRFALALSGGRYVEGTHPKFLFQNEAQRIDYERTRKRLREEDQSGTTSKGDPEARKFERKHSYPRKLGS